MMKTAVIGASGYIGRNLLHAYRTEFPDCVGTSFTASDAWLMPFDIRDPDVARLRLIETGHQAVLLAAAKSNVGWCDDNAQDAYDINVKGTLECVRQIGKLGLSVIFLSSDYVFDGKCAPYRDIDEPRPSTEYGYQKATVEAALPQFVDDFLILRLSKVYGTKKGDATLLDQMARLLSKGAPVRAAYDQKFCPTYINDIIEVLRGLQTSKNRGVMNLCSPRGFSRYEVARDLAAAMKVDPGLVQSVSLLDLPGMGARPLDTRMYPSEAVIAAKPEFARIEMHIDDMAEAWSSRWVS